MKSLFYTVIALLLAVSSVYAQKPEPAQALVKYHFTHIRDTTQREKPYKENLELLLGRNASAYISIDARLQIERMNNEISQQFKNAPDPNHVDLTISGMRTVAENEYFLFTAERKMFVKQKLINFYLTEEPLPAFKWTITNDTTTINTLHCQKATAHFKGRDYEAWFCADLPFHSGPWKLNGLPGLIVQATDSKKEVIFEFAGMEDVSQKNLTVALPNDVIRTTDKELVRLKDLQKTDPAAFSKMPSTKSSRSPMDNIDVSKIKSINITKSDNTFSRTINNPIELPEKK
ncbi:GLPGLI family protein [Mucilaginibacter agri]|uniref:GLPGLI family protein n=1 Tax=Mucilaginibacter agri TaxID=2695265 RepID=A0A965ZFG7_9SPHI|nr:GLPGLI family protein [Mucilaginibacter agri]NCD69029.1 GLPGLI family protein [Mucilaginibacter agri]